MLASAVVTRVVSLTLQPLLGHKSRLPPTLDHTLLSVRPSHFQDGRVVLLLQLLLFQSGLCKNIRANWCVAPRGFPKSLDVIHSITFLSAYLVGCNSSLRFGRLAGLGHLHCPVPMHLLVQRLPGKAATHSKLVRFCPCTAHNDFASPRPRILGGLARAEARAAGDAPSPEPRSPCAQERLPEPGVPQRRVPRPLRPPHDLPHGAVHESGPWCLGHRPAILGSLVLL